jgi:hypothetical protein
VDFGPGMQMTIRFDVRLLFDFALDLQIVTILLFVFYATFQKEMFGVSSLDSAK